MLAPVTAPLPAFTAVLFGLSGCLVDFGAQARNASRLSDEHSLPTPGALKALQRLHQQAVPCAWLDELPDDLANRLAQPLSQLISATPAAQTPWPAPHACWQALMELNVGQLDGCVLVSGEPRLLQAGLSAGLWTVGLASCGSLCGQSPSQWNALTDAEREYRRGQATLQLYALGVHSAIDHLGELESCLADIALRRTKGEKP
ncbi:HAD family phosphatase [Pseudomonas sp. CDFA 553]|uniref:HAD family phosphatase n=1 Tax=Pseudomonas quasicaspiana TaxID=2829821 RepID=UPI001E312BC3|nr:HAD family phosphatase [Pseudomonas quasicaspiana]MCD5990439.1 HAD family phosphatase [Pseudomonas quasicaspiana]